MVRPSSTCATSGDKLRPFKTAGVAALTEPTPEAPVVCISDLSRSGPPRLRPICVSNSLTNMGPAPLALPSVPF
jgi:hypothetical protein